MKKQIIALIVFCFCMFADSAVRIKDVARVEGLEEKRLIGYGLVVGLDGSGDGSRTMFTVHSIINMLRNLGIYVPDSKIRVRNVAAVMVTATMEPFYKRGAKMDVTVSSIGDANSLEGGMLLMTPLQDENAEVYALAQGAVSVGGYSVSSASSYTRKKNHTLSGIITNGAIVKKEVLSNELNSSLVKISLKEPDFTSISNMKNAINTSFNSTIASTMDAATVEVIIPREFEDNYISFISQVELVEFETSIPARVVLNEKTGTIVAGSNVTISEVAVSHGNITVTITREQTASQPAPQSLGTTAVEQRTTGQVEEEVPRMVVLKQATNVNDLANALNDIGVSPRDMVAIFQAIKKAGALHADLKIM